MKIEVAESLMLSWLRHAKKCQIVQLNWKPSSSTWELHNQHVIERLLVETSEYFSSKYGLDLFKKNSSYTQLLQQSEIDALGIEINGTVVSQIYGIDVAFHENGLNYGSKEETISRVLKKMIRTAMVLHGYFNIKEGEILFASPKVYGIISEPLKQYIRELDAICARLDLHFDFKLICNEDFRDQILNVVMKASKSVSDMSEIFMRSMQMFNLSRKPA